MADENTFTDTDAGVGAGLEEGHRAVSEEALMEVGSSATTALCVISQVSTSVGSVNTAVQGCAAGLQSLTKTAEEASVASNTANVISLGLQKSTGSLNEALLAIEDMTAIIGRLAEQTRLISLNASIEASRAGKAGRTFAVVATEVKGLADEVTRAADGVADRIDALSEVVNDSLAKIDSFKEVIETVDRLSAEVANAVSTQSESFAEMTDQISTAAEGIDLVVDRVEAVAEFAMS